MPSTKEVVSAATGSATHLMEGQGVEVDQVFHKHDSPAGHVNTMLMSCWRLMMSLCDESR